MVQIAENTKREGSKVAQRVAIATADALIDGTPVDTSQAVSNWQVGLTVPDADPIPPHVPGLDGSTAAASRAIAKKNARAKIRQAKPGETIWISNHLDYIGELDGGSSTRAPGGFVRRAIIVGTTTARKAKVRL